MSNQSKERNSSKNFLEINSLSVQFGGLLALNEINISVEKHDILGIIGPNGAGKSTLLNSISGFTKITSGCIQFLGNEISGVPAHKIAKLGISRVFQNLEVLPDMNVVENLLIARHLFYKSNLLTDMFGLPSSKVEEKNNLEIIYNLLERIGLQDLRYRKVGELPYGNRKLLEICRAILLEPKLILFDEPVAGMNDKEIEKLEDLIKFLPIKEDITVMIVEHNLGFISNICNKISVLDFGRKIAEGNPEEIQNNPIVQKAYLGEEVSESEFT
ncbi:ABC transporter ATP-binding protein [Neobacillus niacini]|uniref:ABC transporter ATP-binding protein n=1 Tax=Neobacillus niacini TaxID=86668 RepID=UPI002FFECE16